MKTHHDREEIRRNKNTLFSDKHNPRLYPLIFSDRFYHLASLRRSSEVMAEKYLSTHRGEVLLDLLGCGTKPYLPDIWKICQEYIGADPKTNPYADVHFDVDERERKNQKFRVDPLM